MFTADVYTAIILFWNELYGHWLKSQREDEYRNFFICMVQLESCWRTPPLENGREDKSQLRGNKCQKFCQEIHFVFQLYKCLTHHELTIYYYTPKFFKNKCSLMMLRTLWIMYSAKLSLTCPCKEVRHASFYHNFPFKVNECLVYKESWDIRNRIQYLWKIYALNTYFTNLKSFKKFLVLCKIEKHIKRQIMHLKEY